jgi:hypothetical protein
MANEGQTGRIAHDAFARIGPLARREEIADRVTVGVLGLLP